MAMTFYEWRRQPGNGDRTLTEYEACLERLARTAARANMPPAAEDALLAAWDQAASAPLVNKASALFQAGARLADAVRSTSAPVTEADEFRAVNTGHGRTCNVVRLTEKGPEIVLRGLWDWQAKAIVAVLSPPWKD